MKERDCEGVYSEAVEHLHRQQNEDGDEDDKTGAYGNLKNQVTALNRPL